MTAQRATRAQVPCWHLATKPSAPAVFGHWIESEQPLQSIDAHLFCSRVLDSTGTACGSLGQQAQQPPEVVMVQSESLVHDTRAPVGVFPFMPGSDDPHAAITKTTAAAANEAVAARMGRDYPRAA